jgi:LysM repeat protein
LQLTIGFIFAMFAYMVKQANKGFFKSREDVVSMFLGLVVVVAVVGFMVSFIEKRKGNIDVPGVSHDIAIEETNIIKDNANNENNVIVQSNDSLWKIATRVYGDGYKWTEIAKANNLKNPNVISKGQKLVLPKIEKVVADTTINKNETVITEKTEYKVIRGDTLWKIATQVYGDGYKWTKIWQDNKAKLNNPDKLEIGMTLVIYGKITQ